WGGAQGTASDIKIHAEEIITLKKRLNEIISKHTGLPVARIEKDSDRDKFMSAAEAKAYGIVDEVVETLKDIEGDGKGKGDMAAREDR
ncbi:MAG TPA: ATP-dependent Clp protease proteolytic subunit, partial [Planctomycetota bacterium]